VRVQIMMESCDMGSLTDVLNVVGHVLAPPPPTSFVLFGFAFPPLRFLTLTFFFCWNTNVQQDKVSEVDMAYILREVVKGLIYLHSINIAHRHVLPSRTSLSFISTG
jgi:serine/threonine protein kinase